MGERLTQDQVAEIRQRFGGTASADAGDLLEDMSALLDHAEATADPDDREGLVEAAEEAWELMESAGMVENGPNEHPVAVRLGRVLRDRLQEAGDE